VIFTKSKKKTETPLTTKKKQLHKKMLIKMLWTFWDIIKDIFYFIRLLLLVMAKIRQCILFTMLPWLFIRIIILGEQLQFTALYSSRSYLEVILILILLILIFYFECIIGPKSLKITLIKLPFSVIGSLMSASFLKNLYLYNIYFIADPLLLNPFFIVA
jgi:hypothetical protein